MEKKVKQLISLVDDYPLWNEIEPNLFLGSVDAFKDESFKNLGIGAVVSITRIPTEEFGLPDWISESKGNHLDICLADHEDENISHYFDTASDFINRHITERHKVFVHCAAGISRSATLITCYIMRQYKMSAYDALKIVKGKRPCVRPNDGFLEQLVEYEEKK